MKSLRKTLHESRLKTHQQVRSWLQPKMGAIGTKYRLAARIRLANAWAAKHPKRTFAYVTAATAAQIGTIFFICFSLIDPITLPETMFRNESKFRKPNKV